MALWTEAQRTQLKKGQVVIFCPFGCVHGADLDEYGYCRHLVGFTNDKKTYEPILPVMLRGADGKGQELSGKLKVYGKASRKVPPLSDDVQLVNPEKQQTIDGIPSIAKEWVSDRVYIRNNTEPTGNFTAEYFENLTAPVEAA